MSLCWQLRSQGYSKPILLLTAKNANADIVAGLDAGSLKPAPDPPITTHATTSEQQDIQKKPALKI